MEQDSAAVVWMLLLNISFSQTYTVWFCESGYRFTLLTRAASSSLLSSLGFSV